MIYLKYMNFLKGSTYVLDNLTRLCDVCDSITVVASKKYLDEKSPIGIGMFVKKLKITEF